MAAQTSADSDIEVDDKMTIDVEDNDFLDPDTDLIPRTSGKSFKCIKQRFKQSI